jgi:N-acetylmuramoyl-L-alanine amidase
MPLPNPSANPVGKRRIYMKKNVIVILAMVLLSFFSFCQTKTYAASSNSSTDLYKEEVLAEPVFGSQSSELYVTDDEVYLMAQTVFAESRSESFEGKVAVASVVLNRMKSPDFPHTVQGVIFQKGAFSCVKNGRIDVIPDASCYEAVRAALKGNDPTSKAVFYYNPRTATSSWMKNIPKNSPKVIGNHVFFIVK